MKNWRKVAVMVMGGLLAFMLIASLLAPLANASTGIQRVGVAEVGTYESLWVQQVPVPERGCLFVNDRDGKYGPWEGGWYPKEYAQWAEGPVCEREIISVNGEVKVNGFVYGPVPLPQLPTQLTSE